MMSWIKKNGMSMVRWCGLAAWLSWASAVSADIQTFYASKTNIVMQEGATTDITLNFSSTNHSSEILILSRITAATTLLPNNAVSFTTGTSPRTMSLTPSTNESGNETFTIQVSDPSNNTEQITFDLTVNPVNDAPTFSSAVSNLYILEDGAVSNQPFSVSDVDDAATNLSVAVAYTPSVLFPSNSIAVTGSGSSRFLSATPVANRHGTNSVMLIVSDDGGSKATNSFMIGVASVDDNPSITGVLPSIPITTTNYTTRPFASISVTDPDSLYIDERYRAFVTVTAGTNFGAFNGDSAFTNTLAGIQTNLSAMVFSPSPALEPAGSTKVVNYSLKIYDYAGNLISGPQNVGSPVLTTGAISIAVLDTPPSGSFGFASDLINDNEPATLASVVITDPDSDVVKVILDIPADTNEVSLGTFTPALVMATGTPAQVTDYLEDEVRFDPTPNVISGTANVEMRLRVISDGVTNSTSRTLSIKEKNDAPTIQGTPGEFVINDDTTNRVFSSVIIADVDESGKQLVKYRVSLSDTNLGTFVSAGSDTLMTPDAAQSNLASGIFIPNPGAVAIGDVESVTLTVVVEDRSGATASDANTQIGIRGVNGPPTFRGIPAILPRNVSVSNTLPFAGIYIEDDGVGSNALLTVRITLDDEEKGALSAVTNVANFSGDATSGYVFSGTEAAVSNQLANLLYEVNDSFVFEEGRFGFTTFSLRAEDQQGNSATKSLPIIMASEPRNILVTRSEDDARPGSLRFALAGALDGDVITFALDEYPALIRLASTNGTIKIDRQVTIKGPGGDNLSISGDSDGNTVGDLQLFEIRVPVRMEGLTLEKGAAEFGGIAVVGENGHLTILDCVLRDSRASQYGGAIDVAGGRLTARRCLFKNNQTSADNGQGGGAVSLYTSKNCRFENCTFSGNQQSADTGVGGGAIYAESKNTQLYLNLDVVHCTFADNADIVGKASSILLASEGARLFPLNNVFADARGRNIEIEGGAVISLGGNLSDDSTFSTFGGGGTPDENSLLNGTNDLTNANVALGAFEDGVYPLLLGSPAIGNALTSSVGVDQLGRFRSLPADSGATTSADPQRVLVNEIQAITNQFIEFYVPRDAVATDLSGMTFMIAGQTNHHVFTTNTVVTPGSGLLLAVSSITTNPYVPVFNRPLDLENHGELKLMDAHGRDVFFMTYNVNHVDPENSRSIVDFGADSSTLDPQFKGHAFLPYRMVGAGAQSPGKDASNTGFGASNAVPVAIDDQVWVGEDALLFVDVLANDADADGTDVLMLSGIVSNLSSTALGAGLQKVSDNTGAYYSGVVYDPRASTNIQMLSAGEELSDSFSYTVKDVTERRGDVQEIEPVTNSVLCKVISADHGLNGGDSVYLVNAGMYDGLFAISSVNSNSFLITNAYFGAVSGASWLVQSDKGGSSSANVDLTIIGANDIPSAYTDSFETVESGVIRLLGDSTLVGFSNIVFDTDALYAGISLANGSLLSNDRDIDTDDDFSSLELVGLLDETKAISAISSTNDGAAVVFTSVGHGLSDGESILIAVRSGPAAYSGSHTVSVLDDDLFMISVPYVGDFYSSASWGRLNDGSPLNATTRYGAIAELEIRSDRAETSVVYDPRSSSNLNAVALGEQAEDEFTYVVADSHGAMDFGIVRVRVHGENETPVNRPDPDSLDQLVSYVNETNDLAQVIAGARVVDAVSDTTDGRAAVRVVVQGQDDADSVVLNEVWSTFENIDLYIPASAITTNDYDEDASDVLRLRSASASELGVPVDVDIDFAGLTYVASTSSVLNALAHNEMVLDAFEVVVTDDKGADVTNAVAVLIVGVNDAPVAKADRPETFEDRVVVLDPRAYPTNNMASWDVEVDINGSKPDDSLWILETNDFSAFGAEFSISNNQFRYDPSVSVFLNGLAANTQVVDVIEYTVVDQSMVFANDDLFLVEADGADFELDVLANDRNFNDRGGELRFVEVGVPNRNGIVATNAAGSALVYTPQVNFVGDEVFVYAVEDVYGNYSRARVTVRVVRENLNGNIQANDDSFTVSAGESVLLPVLFNDNTLPASGSALTIVSVHADTNVVDEFSIEGNAIRFTDVDDALDEVELFYEVSGGGSARATAKVMVSIVDRRDELRAQRDYFHVGLNSRDNVLDVVLNDNILPETGQLTIVFVDSNSSGEVEIDTANNRLLYTPKVGFAGKDSFTYRVSDELGGTSTKTVEVMVGNPVVLDDIFTLSTNVANARIDVLFNDRVMPNAPDALRIENVSGGDPALGDLTISVDEESLLFTARSNETGSATYTYTVRDGEGNGTRTLQGSLTLVVEEDGVFANPDVFEVARDDAVVSLSVLMNDASVPERGRSLSITAVGVGADAPDKGGSAIIAPDNQSILYTPVQGFVGEESFTYSMTDAYGSDSARVTVRVGAPVISASDDAYGVYFDGLDTPSFTLEVLANDQLLPAAGGALEILGVGINDNISSNAPNRRGVVEPTPDGTALIYTPFVTNASLAEYQETFTYEVGDGTAARASAEVTITVYSRSLERDTDLDEYINPDRFSVARNSSLNVLPVLNNDGARPAGVNAWTITSLGSLNHGGQAVVVGDEVLYTPRPDFTGTETFTYTISDGLGGASVASIDVKVGDVGLNSDRFTVVSGTSSNMLNVLVNDGILPGPDYPISVDFAGGSLNGATVTTNMDATAIYYTPSMTRTGSYPYVDKIFYGAYDDSSLAVTQWVDVVVVEQGSDRDVGRIEVTVKGVNDAPRMFGFTDLLETDDKTAIAPFGVSSVRDVDEWGDEAQTVTITLDQLSKGELVSLGSFVKKLDGSYESVAATPAETTASLRGLRYVPVENRIPGGTNETVRLEVRVLDPYIPAPLTHQLDVVVWSANDDPVITGVSNVIQTLSNVPVAPFATTSVADVDEGGTQIVTARISLDDQAKGDLTSLSGFNPKTPGSWEMTADPATVSTALNGLMYEPATNRLAVDEVENSILSLEVRDAYVSSPSSASVTVRVTGANPFRVLWRSTHFTTNSADGLDGLDPDGDGVVNIMEYVFGSDPNDDECADAGLEMSPSDEAGIFTVSYTRRVDDPTLAYVIERSADLSNWSTASSEILDESSEPVEEGVVRTTATIRVNGDARFYRVKVSY